jgi:hypothetical protein
MRVKCPAHLILLQPVNKTRSCNENSLQSSLLCNSTKPHVTFSLKGPTISYILLTNIPQSTGHSSVRMGCWDSCKTKGRNALLHRPILILWFAMFIKISSLLHIYFFWVQNLVFYIYSNYLKRVSNTFNRHIYLQTHSANYDKIFLKMVLLHDRPNEPLWIECSRWKDHSHTGLQ